MTSDEFGALADGDADWCYFITHLFFVVTMWLTRPLPLVLNEPGWTGMVAVLRELMQRPGRWQSLEVLLQWACCLVLLGRRQSQVQQACEALLQRLRVDMLAVHWTTVERSYVVIDSAG